MRHRTDTLVPCTTRFRSELVQLVLVLQHAGHDGLRGQVLALQRAAPAREGGRGFGSRRQRLAVELGAMPQPDTAQVVVNDGRSEEHTSELQSLMRISYAVVCLTQKTQTSHLLLHTL